MRFYDTQQARMRLDRSVVMYKDKPILMRGPDEDWSARYIDLSTGQEGSINDIRKVKTLSLRPVPLGFCNHGGRAMYLLRMPCRRYKQGLATQNLMACSTTGQVREGRMEGILQSTDVADTILRRYPDLRRAVSRLKRRNGNALSVAFHPNWALSVRTEERDPLYLSYKSLGIVGTYQEETFKFYEEYDYLETALEEEVLIHVP